MATALAEAETFDGWAAEGTTSKRGERVFLEIGTAALVDGLDLKVVDHGSVTITDRRMVFHGAAKKREWAFAKLVGYQHVDETPATLVQVANRQRISGVSYSGADEELFRRRLAIAAARASGSVDALVRSLRTDLAAHDAQQALPEPPAAPQRWTAARVFGGWPRWAQIGAPLLGFAILIAPLAGGDDENSVDLAVEQGTGTDDVIRETTSTTPAPTTSASEAPTTTTTAPPATAAAPSTTTTAPPPPPPPPPTTAVTAPPPPPPAAAVTAPAAPAAPAKSGDCHPSYDPCLPITGDVDCGGGSGNGPAYTSGSVRVIGPDEYDLDRDGDGIGCDS